MKFAPFPFLRYVLFFAAGIILYELFSPSSSFMLWGLLLIAGLWLAYAFFTFRNSLNRTYTYKSIFPFLAYALLLASGYQCAHFHDPAFHPDDIHHFQKVDAYLGRVKQMDEPKTSTSANIISVTHIHNGNGFEPASGNVMIYHKLPGPLTPGEIVLISGAPQPIPSPKNPGEFDYRKFLARRGIGFSHFVGHKISRIGNAASISLTDRTTLLRAKLAKLLSASFEDKKSLQVASALLLGQKSALDEEVSDAYITAGAMHVLAVSGLHVGIIYGFFLLFIKPAHLSPRKRIFFLTAVVCLIWGYALLTGLSPSVLRAATMFTLLAIGQMNARSAAVFNTLALSALLLMLFNPSIIFEVGFQLSYAAMFGILVLQPWIVSAWLPRNRLLFYLWEITAVSIAAQLATLPLSIYYFHVFPNYFLLTNLLVIPAAFGVMAIGIPFLIIGYLGWSVDIMAAFLETVIHVMNTGIFWIQQLPYPQTTDIYVGPMSMVLLAAFIWFGYVLFTSRKKGYAYVWACIVAVMVLQKWFSVFQWERKEEILLYSLDKGWALDYRKENTRYYFDSDVRDKDLEYKVSQNRGRSGQQAGELFGFADEEGGITVILPEGKSVALHNGEALVNGAAVEKAAIFQESKWKSTENAAPFSSRHGAVKLILMGKE